MKLLKFVLNLSILGYVAYAVTIAISGQVADPVQYLLHTTGLTALKLLLLTVAIGPIAKWLNKPGLNMCRKMLGLYTFAIAGMHLLTYLTFDLQYQWAETFQAIIYRPYITLGFLSFVLLTLLALSSFDWAKKRLNKYWKRIHNGVYVIIVLCLLHFSWSQKTIWDEALYYWLTGLVLLYLKMKPQLTNAKR
ncbi:MULTISPECIES: sulfite oxidase heme-binding subunit YedZ [unclassified Vibrio]|uniref:Protein-methionine-sulfoxide reductase heme-binding subunit MsrQ n=1 Tax=Vibrio sp. HB236076 TaxID=3232307 RepID=A0AB39HJD9_9VIBR|nr:ferric reductase-like transmembrane domain-containing protein [Vibrio sp. HB161653]MDP5252682.1 ferric reductase-like transmembrane domain-containing protein [Vibrio sp. HB161653]